MYEVDRTTYRSVKGFNRRVRFLIMHYTAIGFRGSVNALTGPAVSAHYLIPDPSEKDYQDAGFNTLRIFNLVDESERAWHAGVSTWGNRNSLNDTSIGIEIVNLATDEGGVFKFPPYHPEQIEAIKQLGRDILRRYPDISPVNVVGHSDISPGRKSDPGAVFPWKVLYDAGVGAWYDAATVQAFKQQFSAGLPSRADITAKLKTYGYDTSTAAGDSGYRGLVRAFQLHFRPDNYNGVVDLETAAIVYALVAKYFPGK